MDNHILTSQLHHEDELKDLPSRMMASSDMLSLADFSFPGISFDPSVFDPATGHEFCDNLGQACDQQQCDPNSVVPCTSVDANPCYNPTCSPHCELDGMDTTCYQSHDAGSSQQALLDYIHHSAGSSQHIPLSYGRTSNTSLAYRHEPARNLVLSQDLPNINRSTSINTIEQHHETDPVESPSTVCFHPEHNGKGCINPQLLLIYQDPNSCCCGDETHIPDLRKAVPSASQNDPRPRSAARKERKKMHRDKARILSPESLNAQTEFSYAGMDLLTGTPTSFDGSVPVPLREQIPSQPNQSVRTPFYQQIPGQFDLPVLEQPHQQVFTPQSSSTQIPSPAQPYQQVFTPQSTSSQTLSPYFSQQCQWVNKETGYMCGMNYNSAADLQAHVEQSHLPQRRKSGTTERSPIVCCWDNCEHAHNEKAFRQNQHLKDHIRTHTQHKPFECDWEIDDEGTICGKGFGEKKALDSHMRTHTKEKPFKCPKCDKTFAHQSTLSSHMIKHATEGVKKYRCPKCDHMDNDRANLSRHWDTHYPPRYMCRLCNKTFSKKANAIRHLNNRSCKCMPANFTEADLKNSIFCQPREKGELDFSMFETKNQR